MQQWSSSPDLFFGLGFEQGSNSEPFISHQWLPWVEFIDIVLGDLVQSHHFLVSFFIFTLPLFALGLDFFSRDWLSLFSPLFYDLFPCFFYYGFPNPNSYFFFLNFWSILIAYQLRIFLRIHDYLKVYKP